LQGLVVGTAIATSDSDYGNLAVGGAGVAAQLLSMRYGRSAELESDKYGMQYMSRAGYDPQGAVELQKTFVRLSEGRNQDWLSGLFASHPPSQARVDANIRTAASLPPGGETGEERYRLALKQTRDAMPAYEAYDKGRAALADKNTTEALALAEKALEMFPAEAHFHALRGDVRLMNKQYDMAVTNYDRAVSRRDDFFYYHLQRGIAKHELGQDDAAVADLERSLALLPTAPAHYTLGSIEAGRGNRAAAIEHYRVVAEGGGEYGTMATAALVRLDLSSNPGNYVPRRCDAAGNGNLVVSVKNETSVPIRGVRVVVEFTDNAGRTQQRAYSVGGLLSPGQVASVDTGLGPYEGGGCPARVVAAELAD
jgi:predicted Zn-dependent protease